MIDCLILIIEYSHLHFNKYKKNEEKNIQRPEDCGVAIIIEAIEKNQITESTCHLFESQNITHQYASFAIPI